MSDGNLLSGATSFEAFDSSGGLLGGGQFTDTGVTGYVGSGTTLASGNAAVTNAQQYINNVFSQLGFGTSTPAATPATTSPSSGGASTGGQSTTAPASASASPTSGGSTNPGQTDTQSAGIAGTIQNYFMRAVIIIVGFIFLAIGLHKLSPEIVPNPVRSIPT